LYFKALTIIQVLQPIFFFFPFNFYYIAICTVTLTKIFSKNYWDSKVQDLPIESRKKSFHFDLILHANKYSLCPIILDTFDKNKNTKKSVRSLQKWSIRTWSRYFTPKMELSVERYDCLIMLWSSFHDQFLIFCIKMSYNLCHGTLESSEIWNLG
jgi:hypothetical protein